MKTVSLLTIGVILVAWGLLFFTSPFWFWGLGISIFVLTIYSFQEAGRIIFFLLPWINVFSNLFFKYRAIPAVLMVLSFWLAGIIFNYFWRREEICLPDNSNWIIAVVIMALGSAIYSFYHYRSLFFNWSATVSTLYSGKPVLLKNALGWISLGFVQWVLGPLCFLFFYGWFKRFGGLKNTGKYLAAGLLISVLIGFYQKFFNIAFANPADFGIWEKRISGGGFDPNALANILFLGGAILLQLLVQKKLGYGYWAISGLLFIASTFTGSRIIFVGWIIMLSVLFLTSGEKTWRISILGCFFLVVAGFFLYKFSPVALRLKTNSLSASFSARFIFWRIAAGIFHRNILLGTGVGRYLLVLPDYLRTSNIPIPWNANENACNYYLQIAAETGLAGILFWAGLFSSLVKKILRLVNKKDYLFLLLAIIFFLVSMLFGSSLLFSEVALLFWAIMAELCLTVENKQC